MGNYLLSFNFSLISLACVTALPFIFFTLYFKNWYDPAKFEKICFISKAICIILAALILVRASQVIHNADMNKTILILLHIAPLVLTLLLASFQRRLLTIVARHFNGMPTQQTGSSNYNPIPVNNAVEHMTWNDLVINENLKLELASVAELLKSPQEALRYGIELPKGILFTGPPGTGKTTIAKVMANEAGLNFFILSSDEIVSKWVGESEKNLTRLFYAAKSHAPAIIFIDEVDSIGRGRSDSNDAWADNLLNHLLQLIDGVVKTNGLYIIAATNRADMVDEALKRSGRLNKVIEIPLPDYESRIRLFELFLKRLSLATKIDLAALAHLTDGKSGADIKAICQQAGLNAFKREAGNKRKSYAVTEQDLELALREFLKK